MTNKREIFISVLEDHKGIIYKITNAYCREVEDRKDLAQEIIIQLWLAFDKYDSQYKYSTWIYRIALNTSISFYRKNKKRHNKTVELSAVLEQSIETESFEEDPNLKRLQRYIFELKEMDRALILLYLEGLSQQEISVIMGISPTNISTKVGRIKKKLKSKFQTIKK